MSETSSHDENDGITKFLFESVNFDLELNQTDEELDFIDVQ